VQGVCHQTQKRLDIEPVGNGGSHCDSQHKHESSGQPGTRLRFNSLSMIGPCRRTHYSFLPKSVQSAIESVLLSLRVVLCPLSRPALKCGFSLILYSQYAICYK